MITGDTSGPSVLLYDFLRDVDLLAYYDQFKNVLKLRHAGDLAFCEEKDLSEIGMSRPEQKRLRYEFNRRFANHPFAQSTSNPASLVLKLRKKVFGSSANSSGQSLRDPTTNNADFDNDKNCSTTMASGAGRNEQHVIPIEHISLCRELGKGDFGHVYQAAWRYGNSVDDVLQVAVKRVLPEKFISNPVSFLQEAAIMVKMRHENIIRLYGVIFDAKAVMLVSELAPCGSLLECLQCPAWREPFSINTLCDFALQIACGMHYLAEQRLIHRDLAARNVLVCSPTKVKICDFGLSRSLGIGEDYYRSEFKSTMRLPIAWCAPESIKFLRFTTASDVWSYGVTLWEMFSYGKAPWANMTGSEILSAIDSRREVLALPEACPFEFYQLMRDCWSYESNIRPNFDMICERLPRIMPQLLITIADSKNNDDWRYLQFKKGDIVILLNKSPTDGANGYFESNNLWLGALKRGGGMLGLFHPEETVAYLGAVYPSSSTLCNTGLGLTRNLSASSLTNGGEKISTNRLLGIFNSSDKSREQSENSKFSSSNVLANESNTERRKLLISQPQDDFRHTCHVGIDGKSFGTLNLGKSELKKVFPPSISPNSLLSQSMTTTSAIHSSPLVMNTTEASNERGIPLKNALQPPAIMPRTTTANENNIPPVLPPKARKTNSDTQKSANVQTVREVTNNVFLSQRDENKNEASISNGETSKSGITSSEIYFAAGDFDQKAVMCAEDCSTLRYFPSTKSERNGNNDQTSEELSTVALNRVLCELKKDITDFSLSTIEDFSDTRPLLESDWSHAKDLEAIAEKNEKLRNEEFVIRTMTPEERMKWEQRVIEEHKKAARNLVRELDAQQKWTERNESERNNRSLPFLSSTIHNPLLSRFADRSAQQADSSIKSCGLFASQLSNQSNNTQIEENWSEEAQAAYKLLVQCGDSLKSTNISGLNSSLLNERKSKLESVESVNLTKKLEYVNPTKLMEFSSQCIADNKSIVSGNETEEKIETNDYINQSTGASTYLNQNYDNPSVKKAEAFVDQTVGTLITNSNNSREKSENIPLHILKKSTELGEFSSEMEVSSMNSEKLLDKQLSSNDCAPVVPPKPKKRLQNVL